VLCCHGGKHVRGECGDAALARQVIAEECDFSDLRWFVHKFVHGIVRRMPSLLYGVKPYLGQLTALFENVVNAAGTERVR
jgi:hypothetical protein